MSNCCSNGGYDHMFDEKEAERNLKRYRKQGLDSMAASMRDYLISRGMEGSTVLEVGGGIGALHLELLKAGAVTATHVELSRSYEAVARGLLAEEGLSDRVQRRVADFVEVASDMEPADDVMMNRVVCCYPDMVRLMTSALGRARRFMAATFPRDRLGTRLAIRAGNQYLRWRGTSFQAFVHDPDEIDAVAAAEGFRLAHADRSFIWQAAVYERVA